jgi:hypothetical protein
MSEKCKILLITTYWYTFQLAEQQFLLLALFLAPARKMTGFSAGTSPQTPVVKIHESI